MLNHKEKREITEGTEYVLLTKDNIEAYARDRIIIHPSGKPERIVSLSTSAGCQTNCKGCAWNKRKVFRPFTSSEIDDQLRFVMTSREIGNEHLTISLSLGGDPMANAYNVIQALRRWRGDYGHKAKFTLSTPGVARSPRFEKTIGEFSSSMNIELHFSIYSTTHEERCDFIQSPNVMSFKEIANLAEKFKNVKIVLNFLLLKGYTYDPQRLLSEISPERISVEIHPLVRNKVTISRKIEEVDSVAQVNFARSLRKRGFSPKFVSEWEDPPNLGLFT